MTQIFLIASFLWDIKTYRSKNLRHLRYLRDYTSRKSGSSTEQVAFPLIRA